MKVSHLNTHPSFLHTPGVLPSKRWKKSLLFCLVFLLMALPLSAFAQSGGVFSNAGTTLFELLCDFIHSPVLAFGVAIVAGALMWGFGSGDENGISTKMVKFVIMAVLIFSMIPLLGVMGFEIIDC